MADPFTLAAGATAASGGGSLLSGAGAIFKGISGAQMYGYQSGIASLNQKIALQNRDYAYATGESEASRYGMKARQEMGKIRAGIGASGIDIGSGSKADVQEGERIVTGIDMAQIRNNAARKAYGFDIEATQDAAQAELYDKAATSSLISGGIGAMSSLVSGSASVADKWLQMKSTFGSGDDVYSGSGGKPTSSGW